MLFRRSDKTLGTYTILVEDSESPDIYVQFRGFESPHEALLFVDKIQALFSDPGFCDQSDMVH